MKSEQFARDGRLKSPGLLTPSVGVFLGACVLFGGDAPNRLVPFGVIAVSGAWLLGLSLYHGGLRSLQKLPLGARLLLIAFVLLPLLQLVPLPPGLWRALPGRELAKDVIDMIGAGSSWRPLTLDVLATAQAAVLYLSLTGLVLATLQLRREAIRKLLILIFCLGATHLLIGLVQFGSGGTAGVFYPSTHRGFLTGLFSNKNHSALFIAAMVIVGYALLRREAFIDRTKLVIAIPVGIVLATALIATFSRAGILLGLIAMAVVLLLSYEDRIGRTGRSALLAGGVAAAVLAVIATSALAARAFGRFAATADDVRWDFWAQSLPILRETFPFGAGLGSFPSLFVSIEKLEWLRPTYLNHVHNDYLELAIEAGLYGVVLVAGAAFFLARGLVKAWRVRRTPDGRLALLCGIIVAMCALHSIVDYPVRRMAVAGIFFFAYTLLLRMTHSAEGPVRAE